MSSFIVKPEERALAEARAELNELREARRKTLLEIAGVKTNTQFKIACIYGNHGLPCIGDLDIRESADPLELADAIEIEVPSYNDFSGKHVAEAIRTLHEKGLISTVKFGREGSPVLYVEPPFWTGQASNNKNNRTEDRKFTESERRTMFQEILSILAGHTEPDELGWIKAGEHGSYENGTPTSEAYSVRAWWD